MEQSRFDKIIDRRKTGCFKYDALQMLFGNSELLPMWVADMDFAVSDEIIAALSRRLKHPVFGYNLRLNDFSDAVISWQKRRFGWDVNEDWMIAVPGLVPAISLAVMALTEPGEGVLIQTPVYRPFYDAVLDHKRKLITSPLVNNNGVYSIDWQDLENKLQQVKLFIFCSPHNPVGRVWTEAELTKIGNLCAKYNVPVFADEIHADIVYPDYKHLPLASLNDFAEFCLTGVSPSKSFNIAGLATAVVLVANEEIRNKFSELNNKLHLYTGNTFGITALIAAYNESEGWLEDLLSYLNNNRLMITDFVPRELPGVQLSPIEGTFLAWLDFRNWGLSDEELQNLIVNKAGLALEPGTEFGEDGKGFMRLNFGCPLSTLELALTRLQILAKEYGCNRK
ncbi:MAG TPA: PatB family C-S lyase [Candidatus Cloacimonas sp.]|nr:PatB family C-S lyase [Candidatus Cloacimonas sp.]